MQEALTARLLAHAPLAALVGDRIHWGRAPRTAALPYVVLSIVDDPQVYTFDGPTDWHPTEVQADVYAETYDMARAASGALVDLLSGWRAVYQAVNFQGVFVLRERDGDATDPGTTDPIYRRSIDLNILWKLET